MSDAETPTPEAAPVEAPKKKPPAPPQPAGPKLTARHKIRAHGRKKRAARLKTDAEFAKTYFEAKSKRSTDKKTAFRKRHAKK